MNQTSYEVVKRAIHFRCPDRLPLQFASLNLDDIAFVGIRQVGTGDHTQRETVDEWGCTWARTEMSNMGQVKGHPLEDWSAEPAFSWPDPDAAFLYELSDCVGNVDYLGLLIRQQCDLFRIGFHYFSTPSSLCAVLWYNFSEKLQLKFSCLIPLTVRRISARGYALP